MGGKDAVPFEEALNKTGFGKFNILLCVLCSGVILGMTFELFSISYMVPGSACEFHTSSKQQGLIAGMPLAGVIVTSHIWGYLADTRGRRKIIVISMTTGFIAGTLGAFSPHWIILSVFKFISSASVASSFALSLTWLSECTPKYRRSLLIVFTTSMQMFSMGIMAVISIPLLPLKFSFYVPYLGIYFNSWRLLGLVFSVPSALGAIACFFIYESPKYLLTTGEEEKALDVLRKIYAINSGKDADTFEVKSLVLDEDSAASTPKGLWSSIVAQTVPMLKPPLLKDTLLLSLLFFTVFICINPMMTWLPFVVDAFMKSVEHGETNLTLCEMFRMTQNYTTTVKVSDCSMNEFAMLMVFIISMILGSMNYIMSMFIEKIGRKQLFIGIQFVAGASSLCLNFSSIWILSAVLFMIYLSGVMNFGFLATFSIDLFPTYVRAMAVCLTLMVGRGAAVFGINILKMLLDANCEAAFYMFGGITLASGMIGFLLPSNEKILNRKLV